MRTLDRDAWLAACDDPASVVVLPQVGGFRRLGARWDTGDRALDCHLVWLVVGGGVIGDIAGRPERLGPGAAMWIQPGTRHRFATDRRTPLLHHLRFHLRRGGDDLAVRQGPLLLEGAWDLADLLRRLLALRGDRHPAAPGAARRLLGLLADGCWRLADARDAGGGLAPAQCDLLRRWQAERGLRPSTVADLARLCRLGGTVFARRFRASFGASPRAWLLRERMRAAAQHLAESHDAVAAVARAMGYADAHVFSRLFKRVLAVSPTQWRETAQRPL